MKSKRQYRQGTVMIVDDVPANLALLSDALEERATVYWSRPTARQP